MKIDLVYLWCNDNDSIWNEKRLQALSKTQNVCKQGTIKARFVNNEELRYSLRSVEMYAPWVNKIYIITDNQVPGWLDTHHPKIAIVDHSDLFEPQQLPLFNSTAIEQRIAFIAGLSEHFLYSNDDMMFANPTESSYFFKSDGTPIARLDKKSRRAHLRAASYCNHSLKVLHANEAIKRDYCINFDGVIPRHQMDPYTRASIQECLKQYKEWSDRTIKSTFRQDSDLPRHIFTIYAIATKQYTKVYYTFFKKCIMFGLRILKITDGVDSICFSIANKQILKRIKKYNPKLICLNDGEETTDEDRRRLKILLETLYPEPSRFELK